MRHSLLVSSIDTHARRLMAQGPVSRGGTIECSAVPPWNTQVETGDVALPRRVTWYGTCNRCAAGAGMDEHRHSREVIADAIGRAERELQAAQRAWPPDGRRVLRIRRRLDELERIALSLLRTPQGSATHCDLGVNQVEGSAGGSGFREDYETDRDVRAK